MSVAVVARIDDPALRHGHAVESAALDAVGGEVGKDALRVGGRVRHAHVAVRGGKHVERALRMAVRARNLALIGLREIEASVEILHAVGVFEAAGDGFAGGEPVVLERGAQEPPLAVRLAVADVEFPFRTEANAHRRGETGLGIHRHIEPLVRRAIRRIHAEDRARRATVVVGRGNHQPTGGVDCHAVGRGARRRHLNLGDRAGHGHGDSEDGSKDNFFHEGILCLRFHAPVHLIRRIVRVSERPEARSRQTNV